MILTPSLLHLFLSAKNCTFSLQSLSFSSPLTRSAPTTIAAIDEDHHRCLSANQQSNSLRPTHAELHEEGVEEVNNKLRMLKTPYIDTEFEVADQQ